MNEAEDKIKEYIERAKEILHEKFPHGDNYGIQITDGEFLNSLLGIAQMLQREEHYQDNLTHWQESTAGVTIDESTIQKSIDKLKD